MAHQLYCPRCLTTFADAVDRCPNLGCRLAPPESGWGRILQTGETLDRNYAIDRVLAVGGAGLTYLARELNESGEPVWPNLAIKVLYSARARGSYLRRLATEAQILQELAHPNIVQCRGFVHRTGRDPYLVTLFEEGGSLTDHLGRHGPLAPAVSAEVIRQVLLALDTAHQKGVVHRDLKPDNVLLATEVNADQVPHIRVADFGIAKVSGGISSQATKHGHFVGTPEFAAPEQFEHQPPTAATDIFAAGGLLYFIVTGRPPVELSRRNDIDLSLDEVLEQIPPTLEPRAEWDPGIHALLQEVLTHTMAIDPEKRWTAHQTIAALTRITGVKVDRRTLDITSGGSPARVATPAVTGSALGSEDAPPRDPVSPPDIPAETEGRSVQAKPVAEADGSAVAGAGRMVSALVLLVLGGGGLLAAAVVFLAFWVFQEGQPPSSDPMVEDRLVTGVERRAFQSELQAVVAQHAAGCEAGRAVAVVTVDDAGQPALTAESGWTIPECVMRAAASGSLPDRANTRARIALAWPR